MVIQSLPFTSESASDRGVFATPPKPGAGGGGGSGEVLVYCWRAHAATCVVCVLAIAIYKSQEEVNTTESSLQYCTVNLRRKNSKLILSRSRPSFYRISRGRLGGVFSALHVCRDTFEAANPISIFSQRKLRYSYRRPGINSIDWGSKKQSPCTHFPCWVLW